MNNTYGTKRPANITSADVDIFYSYRPTRSSDSSAYNTFKKVEDPSTWLYNTSANTNDNDSVKTLPGMFDLRLPLDIFGSKGIYTIYIKPKEIYTQIVDVSTLVAYPNIRGIVIDTSALDSSSAANGGLVGYRVEYFDGDIRQEDFRIITSSNRCEPVAQNLNDASQKGIRYRFNDSSNLVFCTLTPSTSLSFKSGSMPNIGSTTQKIALINTKFNPVMMEVEMVEHDDETITNMLEGDQIRDLDNATITTYNENKEIYHHAEYYTLKNRLGDPLYEVKKKKSVNSNELSYNNIVSEE